MILYWHFGNQNIEWVIVVTTKTGWFGVSIMCPTSDTGSVDCCFCEIAPKSNFMCNCLVQRRHHYHLVNKKHVLPFGHLDFFFIWSFVLSRHFFVCLYLYCHCRSNYQEGGGDPILQFTADTILCQSQARNWISIDICCGLFFQSFEMRCSCLFCWYICTCKSSVLAIIYFPYIKIYLTVNFIYTNVPDGSGDLLISVWN
jgi:hypothetical protein